MIFGSNQKLIDIHTYINTSIHTYILTFARRINIDFNSCATHRIEIPKRTRLGEDFQKATKIFSEIELSGVKASKDFLSIIISIISGSFAGADSAEEL